MKNFYWTKLFVILMFSLLSMGKVAGQYKTIAPGGDYDVNSSWENNDKPTSTWKTITIAENSLITKEGNFNWDPKVTVDGTFNVNGSFSSGYGGTFVNGVLTISEAFQGNLTIGNGATVRVKNFTSGSFDVKSGGTLIIEDGDCTLTAQSYIRDQGRVEVFGDFDLRSNIDVKSGGVLIVNGSFNAAGNWGMKISGDVVVREDFAVSNGNIKNSGNVVIGGDFTHAGGGFGGTNDDNFYILNPDADIDAPNWTSVGQGEYGDSGDFDENEKDNDDLLDIVGEVLPEYVSRDIIWEGNVDTNWLNPDNWRGSVPGKDSSVKIKEGDAGCSYPVISGTELVELKNLTIESGAEIIVASGASLDISNSFTNNGVVVLKSTPNAVASLNVPENNTDSGQGRIELSEVKANQWYRIGLPVNDGAGAMLDVTESGSWVYRSAKSWEKITTDNELVAPMEGIMVLYEADHVIDFEGTLNTGEMTRTIDYGKGYYLFSNPYPSAMKWDVSDFSTKGVNVSDNVSSTIYYRVYAGSQVGDYMITYNGFTGQSTLMSGGSFPAGYTPENIGEIAPLQSVWVKVNDAEPATITVNNKARRKEHTIQLKSASASSERSVISLMQTNEFVSDATILSFDDIFADGFDRADSEKMFNGSKNVPEIYTLVEGKSLSINGMSGLNDAALSIPLSVRNQVESEITFSWDLAEFAVNYNVFLEDKATGSWVNMREAVDYIYSPEKMGDNHDRFVLHLEQMQQVATSVADVESENAEDIQVIAINGEVLVRIDATLLGNIDATVEVVDLNGRLIENVKTRETETQISLPAGSAMYVVKVNTGDVQKVEKVMAR